MKTLFTFTPHSFVDLITNSSSELFICDTTKSIDMVKDILREIADSHSRMAKISGENCSYNKDNIFHGFIREPYVSKYTFNYKDVPADIWAEYGKYHTTQRFGTSHSMVYLLHQLYNRDERPEDHPRYKALLQAERDMEREIGFHDAYTRLYNTNKPEYDRLSTIAWERKGVIWKEYEQDKFKAEMKLFKWFLKANNFSDKKLARVQTLINRTLKEAKGRWVHLQGFNETKDQDLIEARDKFDLFLGYHITVKKGDIMIDSADDNSVPSELMDAIEAHLNAQRWHIG